MPKAMSKRPKRSCVLNFHTSLPSRSKQPSSPEATNAHTCLPSVEGDAEAPLPSSRRTTRSLPPSFFFHNSLPAVLTHNSTRSPLSSLVRNSRSPQTIGVEPPMPGSGSFQARFSVALQEVGTPVSLLTPSRLAPRQCGQLSARAGAPASRMARTAMRRTLITGITSEEGTRRRGQGRTPPHSLPRRYRPNGRRGGGLLPLSPAALRGGSVGRMPAEAGAHSPAARMTDQLLQGDCLTHLAGLPAGCIDLAFADPPFNIGYEYDVYRDRKSRDAYLDWTDRWLAAVRRVLKPSGSFYVAIGDEYAAEVKVRLDSLGLAMRNWIIWHYTFGVSCQKMFNRSHALIFYYVADRRRFTFNAYAVRVPSARQTTYADRRANPTGKLPDDTWVLRPQQDARFFRPGEDTWYVSRVCGTFKERTSHPCQMPEAVLERIIRASSNPGDLVLDPFAGSGTTLAVAKRLGRRFLGVELSADYTQRIRERLRAVHPEPAPKPTERAS